MANATHIKVTARECHGNTERMIRRFIKKVKKERILEAVKEDIYYNDVKYKAVDTIIKYKNFLNKYLN